jgi:hypothetical protein
VAFITTANAGKNQAGLVDSGTVANSFACLLHLSAFVATLNEALIDRAWRIIKADSLRVAGKRTKFLGNGCGKGVV